MDDKKIVATETETETQCTDCGFVWVTRYAVDSPEFAAMLICPCGGKMRTVETAAHA